jgi:hypothetical protein
MSTKTDKENVLEMFWKLINFVYLESENAGRKY